MGLKKRPSSNQMSSKPISRSAIDYQTNKLFSYTPGNQSIDQLSTRKLNSWSPIHQQTNQLITFPQANQPTGHLSSNKPIN
jgi:hypothetical protein